MATKSADIEITARLNGSKFVGDSKRVSAGVKGIGNDADKTRRKFSLMGSATTAARKPFSHLSGEAKGLAKNLLAAGAAYGTVAGIKSAVNTTVDLGKATLGLSRNLGFSTEAASEWAAVANVRGIGSKALTMSFTTLSKQVDAARHGGDRQAKTFARLGITTRDLGNSTHDYQGLLGKVADGFGKLHGGTKRQAIAQQLLGRGYQTVLPLFTKGSKSLNDQLALAKKYGATFGGTTVEQISNYVKAQREAQFAQLGWQITVGTLVLPTLTKFVQGVSKLSLQFRNGTGTGGKIRDTVTEIGQAVGPPLKDMAGLALATAKFTGEHPEVAKMVGVVIALGLAAKTVSFAGSITGVTRLLKYLDLVPGEAAKGKAAMATSFGPASGARAGGRWGKAFGKAGSYAIAATVLAEAPSILADIGDALLGKGNAFSKEARSRGYKDLLSLVGIDPESTSAHDTVTGRTPEQQRNRRRDPNYQAYLERQRRRRARRAHRTGAAHRAIASAGVPTVDSGGAIAEAVLQPIQLFLDGKLLTEVVGKHTRNARNHR